ncbi:hypothetical protein [Nonomuraea sp. NPDC005501]
MMATWTSVVKSRSWPARARIRQSVQAMRLGATGGRVVTATRWDTQGWSW